MKDKLISFMWWCFAPVEWVFIRLYGKENFDNYIKSHRIAADINDEAWLYRHKKKHMDLFGCGCCCQCNCYPCIFDGS